MVAVADQDLRDTIDGRASEGGTVPSTMLAGSNRAEPRSECSATTTLIAHRDNWLFRPRAQSSYPLHPMHLRRKQPCSEPIHVAFQPRFDTALAGASAGDMHARTCHARRKAVRVHDEIRAHSALIERKVLLVDDDAHHALLPVPARVARLSRAAQLTDPSVLHTYLLLNLSPSSGRRVVRIST
jgi:hypothetical protein